MPDIPSKFQKDSSITFKVILQTHKQTNKNRQKHYLLGGSNNLPRYERNSTVKQLTVVSVEDAVEDRVAAAGYEDKDLRHCVGEDKRSLDAVSRTDYPGDACIGLRITLVHYQ